MKRKIRNLKFAFLALLLPAARIFGFDAVLTIQPPLIELRDSAVLRIEVRNAKKLQAPALPDVPGLQFVNAGQSQQSIWVNGKSDNVTVYNFKIHPQQTGDFTIGPFEYKLDGENRSLQGRLKVVAGSGDAAVPQSWSDILFARLEPDRKSAYVQEPFGLMFSLYARQDVQITDAINLQGMPETGLSDLKWQEIEPSREVVNGAVFSVRRFSARTRAVSSGIFEFSPVATAQVVIPNQRNQQRDPFFSSFFDRIETRPVNLPVEKTAIEIKPLPETGRPDGFSGAVGHFSFQTAARPLETQPGEPITLMMTVSGEGNFDRITAPSLPESGMFRLYGQPVRRQEDHAVRFEQIISPRTADITEIPAIDFAFFDTKSGQYRTLKSRPIPITVTAASNTAAQVFASKESVMLPPQDTPFVTESDLQRLLNGLQKLWRKVRPWLWSLCAVLGVSLIAFPVYKIHRNRRCDTARIRKQKAPKAARQALKKADQAIRSGDRQTFYNALWDALTGYFGHRLNLPPGNITAEALLIALNRAGADPELNQRLNTVFNCIEASRYGQSGNDTSAGQMEQLQTEVEHILKTATAIKL